MVAVTEAELLRRVGPPDAETGGAVPVYVWRLDDGDTIQVTTPDLVSVQTVYWLQARTQRRQRVGGVERQGFISGHRIGAFSAARAARRERARRKRW